MQSLKREWWYTMTNRAYVLDVSAFQPQATYYSFWAKWRARGVRGAIVKLTESTSWRNVYGAGQIAAAKHEGMKVSGYHFSVGMVLKHGQKLISQLLTQMRWGLITVCLLCWTTKNG